MSVINLSYLLTTFNKIDFLKVTVPILIKNLKPDEEIVVVDGGSTDGAAEFLQELYANGQIQQFLCEKDEGEAHGFNKAFLLARGKLLKIVSDDDVYDFGIINKMKDFMLANPDYEMAISNLCQLDLSDPNGKILLLNNYEVWFSEWQQGIRKSTFFCGLTIMLAKKALSRLGLFDTSYKYIDLEYSARVTYKKAKIKFFPEVTVVALINEKSNSLKWVAQNAWEHEKVSQMYGYEHRVGTQTIFVTGFRRRILRKLGFIKHQVISHPNYNVHIAETDSNMLSENISALHEKLLSLIGKYNNKDVVQGQAVAS